MCIRDRSLALPAGAMEKIFVYSHDLYCPRNALKDYQESTGGRLREEALEAAAIRRKVPKFYYNAITRTLYRRSHDGILLRCLSPKEAQEVLKEAHDGMCGAH